MEYVKAAAGLAGVAFDVGTVAADHLRENHLHREAICQSLRIHERDTRATRAYHRVEVRQSNRIHARELLQSELQHLENIDLEKRMAFRENLRDEWEQITGKTDTILVVNTLMLGVAFAMLVEGNPPGHISLVLAVAPTIYYALIAFAISLLILSVRMSMILRFRVGRMIVKEMKRSLVRARALDDAFRSNKDYKKSNIPVQTVAACDDKFYKEATEPITATQIIKADPDSIPAFLTSRAYNNVDEDCEPSAGFSIRSHLPCGRRRAVVSEQFRCVRRSKSPGHFDIDGSDCGEEHVERLEQRVRGRERLRRQPSSQSVGSLGSCTTSAADNSDMGSGSPATDVPTTNRTRSKSPFTPRSEVELDAEAGQGAIFCNLKALAETHVEMSKAREQEDLDMEKRLDDLKLCYCKPYDRGAQESFFFGTLLLLVCACLFALFSSCSTYDRSGEPIGAPYGFDGTGPFFPTQPLAGYAFLANACITLIGLAIAETKNRTAITQWSSTAKAGGAQTNRYNFGSLHSSFSSSENEEEGTQDVDNTSSIMKRLDSEEAWTPDPISPSIMIRRISIALVLSTLFWIVLSCVIPIPTLPKRNAVGKDDIIDAPSLQLPLSEFTPLSIEWPAFFHPTRGVFDSGGCHCLVAVDSLGRAARLLPGSIESKELVAVMVPPSMSALHYSRSSITVEDLWWNLCVLRSARGDPEGRLTLLRTGDRLAVQTSQPTVLAHIQPDGIITCSGLSASSFQVWFGSPRPGGEQALIGGSIQLQSNLQSLLLVDVRQWVLPPVLGFCGAHDPDCCLQDATLTGESAGLLVTLIRHANSPNTAILAVDVETGKPMFALLAPPGSWKAAAAAANDTRADTFVLLGEAGDVVTVDAS